VKKQQTLLCSHKPAQLKEFHVGIRILQNTGIQKAVNATAPFSMGRFDITGFVGP
jgi:hypothetical protein